MREKDDVIDIQLILSILTIHFPRFVSILRILSMILPISISNQIDIDYTRINLNIDNFVNQYPSLVLALFVLMQKFL